MIDRLAALPRCLYRDAQAFHGLALPHVLVQALGAKLALDLRLFGQRHAAQDLCLIHRSVCLHYLWGKTARKSTFRASPTRSLDSPAGGPEVRAEC